MPANRTFEVKTISRVEGEGALYVKLDGERIEHVELNIYEPPRFFEAFLRGREVREVPDITARICGICPVAYQMSAAHALEKALGFRFRPRSETCDVCCIAANTSKATPCTFISSTPRIFWGSKAVSAWRPSIATWWKKPSV
jgi:coenzyme F420-reducing hydrogenase alpha subunit